MDLIDEFSDGRIQFAFVRVKDPNTTLPKSVLIAWVCLDLPVSRRRTPSSNISTSAAKVSQNEPRDTLPAICQQFRSYFMYVPFRIPLHLC